jgi:nucleoside phosphorylase
MIAVFAALQAEVSACLGALVVQRETEIAGVPVIEADGAVVARTGLGPRARDASEAVLAAVSPAAVLSVGIAGGLSPRLEGGDVVLCERIDHESHRGLAVDETVFSHPGLVEAGEAAARGVDLPVYRGSSLTIDDVAWGPDEKAHHHSWKAHDIVEMESFWVGEAAARHGIPFLAVRTISDTATDRLHQTGAVRDDGTFDQDAFLAYVREHPGAAPEIAQSAELSRRALGNLALVMAGLLPPLIQHFRAGVR